MPDSLCPACGASTTAGGRFCHKCGRVLTRTSEPARAVWISAIVVTLLATGGTIFLLRQPSPPADAPDPGVAPPNGGFTSQAPDISTLSARQAFDRLFNRVMAAAEQGDSATVVRFSEHALAAYTQLDSVDADARYHAAVLQAQVGRYDAALALADTILARAPGHLLGWLVRGTVAELRNDPAALAIARREFLAAWARDPGTGRSEYLDHKPALDQFYAASVNGEQ